MHGLIKRGGRKPEGGAHDVRSLAARLQEQRRAEIAGAQDSAPEPHGTDTAPMMEELISPAAPEAMPSPAPQAPAFAPTTGAQPPASVTLDPAAVVAAAKAQRAATAPAQATPRQCLIVDDSRVIRKVGRRIAESLGYQVIEAENGAEALARCRVSMPTLVLTDWQMPVMSGPEFVAQLRALPAERAPVVVFCTSKGAARDIHEGIAAGADDYVIKPFDEAQLKAKLEGLA